MELNPKNSVSSPELSNLVVPPPRRRSSNNSRLKNLNRMDELEEEEHNPSENESMNLDDFIVIKPRPKSNSLVELGKIIIQPNLEIITPNETESINNETDSLLINENNTKSVIKLKHQDSFVHRKYHASLSQDNSVDENNDNKNEITFRQTTIRSKSDSGYTTSSIRRDSVIRQSFNSIFRRSKIIKKRDKEKDDKIDDKSDMIDDKENLNKSSDTNNNSNNSSSVSNNSTSSNNETEETKQVKNNISSDMSSGEFVECSQEISYNEQFKKTHSRNNSSSSSSGSYRSTSSVGLSIPATPMSPLQGHSESHLTTNQGQSAVSLNTISRSPSHVSTKSDSKSQKQLSTSPSNRSPSPVPGKSKSDISEKEEKKEKEPKEKKRKELSSSRQKKFHRHFQQVDNNEKVINYFSCALVSDILLQGHLYITQNYLAFYSNVFGYVTKLLIPTVSVTNVTKEKTGKIFPNAVGVTTSDERHVFGSFMSRESAFRLMCNVCNIELIGKPEVTLSIVTKLQNDLEVSSIEDDSSCSISGNESPPQNIDTSSNENSPSSVQNISSISEGKDDMSYRKIIIRDIAIQQQMKNSHQTTPNSNIHHNNNNNNNNKRYSLLNNLKFKFPTDVHIVYLGVILAVILSLFSGFLLYKIQDIQARTTGFSGFDLKLGGGHDIDIYAEVLRWQKEMQSKSAEEAQIILSSNLEQIARVRKSLETLSVLIHDSNSPFMATASPPLNSFHASEDVET